MRQRCNLCMCMSLPLRRCATAHNGAFAVRAVCRSLRLPLVWPVAFVNRSTYAIRCARLRLRLVLVVSAHCECRAHAVLGEVTVVFHPLVDPIARGARVTRRVRVLRLALERVASAGHACAVRNVAAIKVHVVTRIALAASIAGRVLVVAALLECVRSHWVTTRDACAIQLV